MALPEARYKRLPVYLLIDCSASMNGDAIAAVDNGLRVLVYKLMSEPHTAEIVWLSIIAFSNAPLQLIPLSPLTELRSLPFRIGNCTSYLQAFRFLRTCTEVEVRTQTQTQKGDWKPIIFLMTDGKPSEPVDQACIDLASSYNVIACGVGNDVEMDQLRKLTKHVVMIKDMSAEAFDQFIDFLGSTLTVASQRTASRNDSIALEQQYTKIVLG